MRALAAMSSEPNVTPMIDVLLVLLIIFMVALVPRRTMDATLPSAVGTPDDAPRIVLEVGPRGRYALNQSPVPSRDLEARLRAVYAGRPDKTLVIRGDPRATYQEVITAMDVARGAGVLVLGLDPRR